MVGKIGLPPGSAIYTGNKKISEPEIRIISYDASDLITKDKVNQDELIQTLNLYDKKISWVHIEPISDQNKIAGIGTQFNLHSLVIEDILSVSHRPKAEEFDDYIFVIIKIARYKNNILNFSQVSFILTKDYLLSFADATDNRFDMITKRLEKSGSRIRKSNSEYLLFALLDYIIDDYFKVLEDIGDEIENLEDEIINNPTKENIQHVHRLKRTLMELKKNAWPMREVLNTLMRSEEIDSKYLIYFRDVYEHVINIMDIIEGHRDSTASFLDIYLSTLSNRMNEIMKTLSIISTIFIPLGFLTGYFGMNFTAMENGVLKTNVSYMYANLAMVTVPVLLLVYFKIRKWF